MKLRLTLFTFAGTEINLTSGRSALIILEDNMKLENNDKKKKAAEQLALATVEEPYGVEEVEDEDEEYIDDFEEMAEDDADEEDDGLEVDALDEDDAEDDEQDDTDTDELDAEEEEPEPVKSKKEGGKLTKAEIRLIALKKENKQLIKEKQELEGRIQEKSLATEKETIKQKLIAEDYDEDVAEKMANDELRIRQLEERQALLDFRDENDSLFVKYPQAKTDAKTIMRNMQATGMTAEQLCRGMYGTAKAANELERRASEGAKGNIPSKSARKPITQQSKQAELTSRDLAYKAKLEREFLGGDKMSTEEFQKFLTRKKSTIVKANERRI